MSVCNEFFWLGILKTNIFEHLFKREELNSRYLCIAESYGVSRAKAVSAIRELRLFKRKMALPKKVGGMGVGAGGSKDWIPAAVLPPYF